MNPFKLANSYAAAAIFSSKISLSLLSRFIFVFKTFLTFGCSSLYIICNASMLSFVALMFVLIASTSFLPLKSAIAKSSSTFPSASLMAVKSFCFF